MNFQFDIYGRIDTPPIVLCELSLEPLCTLFLKGEPIFDLNFNDISTVEFKVPKIINGEPYFYYDLVQELRIIHVPGIGYFQLMEPVEDSDGIETFKTCRALSVQSMLQSKRITKIEGQYKLYNALKPYESIMGVLMTLIPDWRIGNVDGVFLTRQRTVNITDGDLYSIMTNNLYETFEAIIIFDYQNFEINIYDANKIFKDTGIALTFENLLKTAKVTPQTDGIITALRVLGADGLDISGVNPTGDTIYNVDYFKDRMSQGLRNALAAYEIKYGSLRAAYSGLLIQYKDKNTEIAALQNNAPEYKVNFNANADGTATLTPGLTATSGLKQLKGLIDALNNVKSVRISQGNIPFADINNLMGQVNAQITNKDAAITNANNQLQSILNQISSINTQLKMESNFTADQWKELNRYFRYDTIQDNGYVITDIMTQDEKQRVREDLLSYGQLVLSKGSVPKYLFEISSVNFLALIEYQMFRDYFELGQTFSLVIHENCVVRPLLLGVHINFGDLSDFKLVYGNQTKINDGFDFGAYNRTVNVSANISFDLVKLEAMRNQTDEVTQFINGALDLAHNNLIMNTNRINVLFDDNGLRIKEYEFGTGRLLPQELWITGKQIVFSRNNFTSAELALGEITAPGGAGGRVYGLVAPAIVGRLIAGNELHISNAQNNFILNETGAYLNNANFTLTRGSNTIQLNPTVGLTIWNGAQNDANRQIYLGTDGNVYFKGNITGGSLNINNRATIDSQGNAIFEYVEIRGGSLRLGSMTITPQSFSFSNGNLYSTTIDSNSRYNGPLGANQISGQLTADQISANSITANHIQSGSIVAEKIAANAIGANHIQSGSITSAKIQAGSITSDKISTGAITASMITAGTMSADRISGGSISANLITSGSLSADRIFGGTIRGVSINGVSITGSNTGSFQKLNCLDFDATGYSTFRSGNFQGTLSAGKYGDIAREINDLWWEVKNHKHVT